MSVVFTFGVTQYQGTQGIIYWRYKDIDQSQGPFIDPVSPKVKLFKPDGTQVDPNDTSVATAAETTPIKNVGGNFDLTSDYYYIIVNWDENAPVATASPHWYVQFAYEHETTIEFADDVRMDIIVDTIDNIPSGQTSTVPVYACSVDLESFLHIKVFDDDVPLDEDRLNYHIIKAEGDFERLTKTAYRPVFVQDEVHDLQAWKQRYPELFDSVFLSHRPIGLERRPVLPIDASRNHKIETYEGEEDALSGTEPVRRWSRWDTKELGRQNDFYVKHDEGILLIRKSYLPRRANWARISYEYGKPITKTTAFINDTTSVIPCESAWMYQTRGMIRIGKEYIFHTGRTDTEFTGCVRGEITSERAAHPEGSEIYEVPDGVRSLIVERAAATFLETERHMANVADGGLSSPSLQALIEKWNKRFEDACMNDYQQWTEF